MAKNNLFGPSGIKRHTSWKPPEDFVEILKRLCRILCTLEECAAFFELDRDSLVRHIKAQTGMGWEEFNERYRGQGRVSLRRQLWRRAIEKDDLKAQIFLAKNVLGMADKVEVRGDDGNYAFFLAYRLKDDEKKDGGTDDTAADEEGRSENAND